MESAASVSVTTKLKELGRLHSMVHGGSDAEPSRVRISYKEHVEPSRCVRLEIRAASGQGELSVFSDCLFGALADAEMRVRAEARDRVARMRAGARQHLADAEELAGLLEVD